MTTEKNLEVPSLQRHFVGEMRVRREAVSLSRAKLAEALGCSAQWLAKVETLEKPPSESLADDLDRVLCGDGFFRRTWNEMDAERRRGLIPSDFRPLVEIEQDAKGISVYQPLMVTGLMQTEALARELHLLGDRPEKTEELVAIRMERQRLLEKPDAPWFFLLMREAVLRDLPDGLRSQQCEQLLRRLEHPKISIALIPAGELVFAPSGFHLLSFPTSPDIAYMEGTGEHGHMITKEEQVKDLAVLFSRLRSSALSARESERMIRAMLEGE